MFTRFILVSYSDQLRSWTVRFRGNDYAFASRALAIEAAQRALDELRRDGKRAELRIDEPGESDPI